MECKCGGETINIVHKVTTLKGAQDWDSTVKQSDLPVTVDNYRCRGCGRESARIFNSNQQLLKSYQQN